MLQIQIDMEYRLFQLRPVVFRLMRFFKCTQFYLTTTQVLMYQFIIPDYCHWDLKFGAKLTNAVAYEKGDSMLHNTYPETNQSNFSYWHAFLKDSF